jgi:hypothetical protein
MSQPRPFSLIIPEDGSRQTGKPSLIGTLQSARSANVSRTARDLPLVRVIHRQSGHIWDVPPDADVMAMADSWDRTATTEQSSAVG